MYYHVVLFVVLVYINDQIEYVNGLPDDVSHLSKNIPLTLDNWNLDEMNRNNELGDDVDLPIQTIYGDNNGFEPGVRIIGGTISDGKKLPFGVSIQVIPGATEDEYSSTHHFCGGALIRSAKGNLYVLTAAHCVYGYNLVSTARVVYGKTDLNAPHGSFLYIEAQKVHGGYDRKELINDIALLKIKQIPDYDYSTVAVAKLGLKKKQLLRLTDKKKLFVAGWGVQQENGAKASNNLMEIQVDSIPRNVCKENYATLNWSIHGKTFCAGVLTGERDSCRGDSGGPLISIDSTTYDTRVLGLVSYGFGCGRNNFPGVYVWVASYKNWIRKQMKVMDKMKFDYV